MFKRKTIQEVTEILKISPNTLILLADNVFTKNSCVVNFRQNNCVFINQSELSFDNKLQLINRALVQKDFSILLIYQDALADLNSFLTLQRLNPKCAILNSAPNYDIVSKPNSAYIGTQRQYEWEIENTAYDILSLASLKSNIISAVPYTNDKDAIVCDLNVVKSSDAPSQKLVHSSGLSSEEFAQLAFLMGKSPSANLYLLDGYQERSEFQNALTMDTILQFIYYLNKGIEVRPHRAPLDQNNFISYTVADQKTDKELIFYKSKFDDFWYISSAEHTNSEEWIPCSYQDYQKTLTGELSSRLIDKLK